ncbi:MAG TPA: DUF222 domain-containing protein, partial [Actinotalea sp.]|nr:DUF222 domain-containing protein [Actinotalea sp.]
LPVREFAAAAARMVATVDPETVEREHDRQLSRRFLVISQQADGTHLRGLLDRVAGAALRVALDSVGFAPDGSRSKEQADADALVAVVQRGVTGSAGVRRSGTPRAVPAAARGDADQQAADARVSGVSNRPTVSVLVPAATVAAAAEHCASAAQATDMEPALLEDGTVLPLSELTRFLCDSELGRVVLDADSLPIDLGRTSRLFSPAQRRAVIVRDRGCAWNGCDVPAAYCEVHHMRWWDRDRGPTDLTNGVLLCSHHHHTVHRCDLTIVREGPPVRVSATWAEPQRYRFSDRAGRDVNRAPPLAAA